jgi:uncharacterized protein YjbJ (UPF0337 family)
MSGKTDIAKGRLEEAAGALTNNDNLRKKGKMNQVVGQIKEDVSKVIDRVAKRGREKQR